MKKFYSLLTAVCVLFMVGCSDDDDDNNKINESYSISDVTLTGYNPSGVTAKFVSKDGKSGTVTFTNLVPGEKETAVTVTVAEDVALAKEYAIEGTAKNGTREITIQGGAGDKLNLKTTFKSLSGAVGEWKPRNPETQPFTLNLKITPENQNDMIDMCGVLGQHEIPLDAIPLDFPLVIGNAINYVFTEMVDFNVNLKDNGYLVASWAPRGEAQFPAGSSSDGLVSFNENDQKQLFIRMPLADLFGRAEGRDTGIGSGSLLVNIGTIGMPLKLDKAGNDGITVSVTKDMIIPYMAEIEALLPSLLSAFNLDEIEFPEDIQGITNENVGNFLKEVFKVIKSSKEFTIEINMQPA